MHKVMYPLFATLLVSLMYVSASFAEQNIDKPIEVALNTALGTTTDLSTATYLGNEGLLIQHGTSKVLFDPFFHNNYDSYQLVPDDIRDALFNGTPPYNDIDAIFVSHAHGDHFAADDVHRYLKKHPSTKLIAPSQAIKELSEFSETSEFSQNLISIELDYRDAPITKTLENIRFEAVRIPHAGWPGRADISNIVFRVTLENQLSVIHMGDADPDDEHFKPLIEHWNSQVSNAAFPPYWFLGSESGEFILSQRLRASQNIGVHVPITVPESLQNTGADYFHKPGEIRSLGKPPLSEK